MSHNQKEETQKSVHKDYSLEHDFEIIEQPTEEEQEEQKRLLPSGTIQLEQVHRREDETVAVYTCQRCNRHLIDSFQLQNHTVKSKPLRGRFSEATHKPRPHVNIELSTNQYYYVVSHQLPSLKLSKELKLAKGERCVDAHCFYHQIICRGCLTCIGRYYVSTTPGIAALNNKFCLLKTKVSLSEFSPFNNKFRSRITEDLLSPQENHPRRRVTMDENSKFNFKSAKISPVGNKKGTVKMNVTQPLRERDFANINTSEERHKILERSNYQMERKKSRLNRSNKRKSKSRQLEKVMEKLEKIEEDNIQSHRDVMKKFDTFQQGINELLNWVVVINTRLENMEEKTKEQGEIILKLNSQ